MMVKAYYEIQVKKVTEDGKTYVEAMMPDEKLKMGKTVHYSTTGKPGKRGLEVTVKFKKGHTPYLNPNNTEILTVTSKEPPIVLAKKGKFFGQCSIKPKIGSLVTYPDGGPGANHDVG